MTDKIVQLIDKDGDNIYPVASVPHGASITMTDTDPGEGETLAADSLVGVYDIDNKVTTDMIEDDAVTSDKIDPTTLQGWELYFDYEQPESVSSGNVIIDVPIDLVNYRRIKIEAADEPGSGSTTTSVTALNGSKNTLSTFQMGYEVWTSTFAHINRSSTEIIAYGQYGACSTMINIDLFRANSVNYPTFFAQAFGGSDTSHRYAQNFMGRITAGPSNVKYIRVTFIVPQSGGWVKAYRLKE